MDRWPRPMRRDAASSALLEFRLKIKDSRIFSFLGFDDIGNREREGEREGEKEEEEEEGDSIFYETITFPRFYE